MEDLNLGKLTCDTYLVQIAFQIVTLPFINFPLPFGDHRHFDAGLELC